VKYWAKAGSQKTDIFVTSSSPITDTKSSNSEDFTFKILLLEIIIYLITDNQFK